MTATAAPAVGVCGFGRCGTTMTMAALVAGGIPDVDGADARSHEVPSILDALTTLQPGQVAGRALKLLDCVLYEETPPLGRLAPWLLIWLDRDHRQQARSQVKFLRGAGIHLRSGAAADLRRSYGADRGRALDALRALGSLHVDSYERALATPEGFVADLATFLAPAVRLDQQRAVAAIHRRSPKCASDLSFESRGVPPSPFP